MNALQTLAQAAGVAYAAGLNLYATVGIIGLAGKLGWIGPLPGSLAGVTSWWVIITALTRPVMMPTDPVTGSPFRLTMTRP